MRVLHVYKAAMPDSCGGVETFIDLLCVGLQPQGVSSTVLALSRNWRGLQIYRGYTIFFVPTDVDLLSTPFSWRALPIFRDLVKEMDLIHYHFPYPFADVLHGFGSVRCPALVTYHADIIKQKWSYRLYAPLMRYFLKRVDHIVATSEPYRLSSSVLQAYRAKVSVIPLALAPHKDHDQWPKSEGLKMVCQRLPKRYFLFLGVLRYYKGLDVLLEALALSSYPIVIAGDGPEMASLKRQAKSLGLDDVIFLGSVDEPTKHHLYRHCEAFVFPSNYRSEAFGLSLLEAARFGKAMISCDIQTGTTFINCHEQTGLVVPPNDPKALSKAMQRLWDAPQWTQALGRAALERSLRVFSYSMMIDAYHQIYQKLGRSSGPGTKGG